MSTTKSLLTLKVALIGYLVTAHSTYATQTSSVGFMPNAEVGITTFVKMFFGLIVVVSIIFAAGWLSKRLNLVQKFTTGYQIKNLATLSLTNREKVSLIEVGGQQILIGIAPGQVRRLYSFDEAIQVEDSYSKETVSNSDGNPKTVFADQLSQFLGRKESSERKK